MPTTRPGYIWSGTEWVAIGQEAIASPVYYQATEPTGAPTGSIWVDSDAFVPTVDTAQFLRWRKTMTGGQTSLSGTDDSGLPLSYTPGYEQLYINGVLQVRDQDYFGTTGNTITGLTALVANDVVEIFSAVARAVGDVYTQAQSSSLYGNGLRTSALLHVRDEKPSGTNGGQINAGAWRTHTLNTVVTNNISGASLASNQITLPAGTYFIQAESILWAGAAGEIQNYKSKLANITDGTDAIQGTGGYVYATSPNGINVYPKVNGLLTFSGTKVIELQNRITGTSGAQGYGVASGLGTEVYAEVFIWKVA